MKNYIKPGENINFNATATIAGGDVVVLGSLVGICAKTVTNGEVGVCCIKGVFKLPKVPATQIDQGDPLFWDAGAKHATLDSATGANPFLGYADSAEIPASATVRVLLARPGV